MLLPATVVLGQTQPPASPKQPKINLTIGRQSLFGPAPSTMSPAYRALWSRGVVQRDRGELDAALVSFNAAIAVDRNQAAGWYDRGMTWIKKSDAQRALADTAEGIRLAPTVGYAWLFRGLAHELARDFVSARGDYEQALKLTNLASWSPRSVHDYARERLAALDKKDAWARCKAENADTAIAACKEVIARPYEPVWMIGEAYAYSALAWGRKGNFAQEIAEHSEAIKRQPGVAIRYTQRALAYERKGDLDNAIQNHEEAIKLAPKEPVHYFNLALTLVKRNQPALVPGRDGDALRALDAAQKSIDLGIEQGHTVTAAALSVLGRAFEATGERDKAFAAYQSSVKVKPFNDWDKIHQDYARYRIGTMSGLNYWGNPLNWIDFVYASVSPEVMNRTTVVLGFLGALLTFPFAAFKFYRSLLKPLLARFRA